MNSEVGGAEGGGRPRDEDSAAARGREPGRALVPVAPVPPAAATAARFGLSHGLVAGAVAIVMGIGFVGGTAMLGGRPAAAEAAKAAAPADATRDALVRVQEEVRSLRAGLDGLRSAPDAARQEEAIRGLKRSVDALKGDVEGVKAASAGAAGQLGAKLDRLDRDPSPKLAEIAARLDRLDREPTQKLADIASRVERIERQVSSADATGSLPPAAVRPAPVPAPMPPQRAASVPPPPRPEAMARVEAAPRAETPRVDVAKADPPRAEPPRAEAPPKPPTVDGWIVRDVYDGVALVEGRGGGLREVMPGEYVPGVGEIRSIERRGRGWVVVTSRGLIHAER